MTNTLAIDTSTEYLSLGIAVAGHYFCFQELVGNKQSEHIINAIKQLLQQAKIEISQIDIIAYVEGPGSFTGLRIGLSVAMGLAFGINAQLVAIPAFALYAKAASIKSIRSSDIVVGIDARLNQIYLAGINATTLDYFIEPQLVNPSDINIDRIYHIVGNGFTVYHNQLNNTLRQCPLVEINYPAAQYLLEIVELNKYPLIQPTNAGLMYLRNKVALNQIEQQLKRQQANGM